GRDMPASSFPAPSRGAPTPGARMSRPRLLPAALACVLALLSGLPSSASANEPARVQATDRDGGLDDAALAIAKQLRDRAMAGSGAYPIVESLTTEVGPRLAGTEADARAVAWAEATFRELG